MSCNVAIFFVAVSNTVAAGIGTAMTVPDTKIATITAARITTVWFTGSKERGKIIRVQREHALHTNKRQRKQVVT